MFGTQFRPASPIPLAAQITLNSRTPPSIFPCPPPANPHPAHPAQITTCFAGGSEGWYAFGIHAANIGKQQSRAGERSKTPQSAVAR